MKSFSLRLVLIAILSSAGLVRADAPAQANKSDAPSATAGLPESDVLMQEYMARRAEWLQLREQGKKDLANAKNDNEKKKVKQKLDADEKALRAAVADLARRVHQAEREKVTKGRPSGG